MSDFYQTGVVTTLHRLGPPNVERLEGLEFDRDDEEKAVETFVHAMQIAGQQFLDDPLGTPLIPTWNRVTAAIPGFLPNMLEAVESDNKG